MGGYINLAFNKPPVNPELLEKMQAAVAHRGPDGYRIWTSPDKQCGLFHRRLSILDLSESGFQPMIDEEHTTLVMCNGEIYNHPQLRAELEAQGYRYHSTSDTETILHAYKEWGIEALQKFNGMFAIVIYDFTTDCIYLVRDRMGIKPLYFSTHDTILSFASEIKALWQLPWVKREINTAGLSHYLTYMVTPAPLTLFNKIYKLPASFYLKIDAQRSLSFHEWYSPLQRPADYQEQQYNNETFCVKKIRNLLRGSIAAQTLSDVPYGVFLSGGIDSSLNTALLSEQTEQVRTFTVAFADGPEYNEIAWARKIARRFNTDHHEIIISEKEAFDFFQLMVYHQDEPLADCVCVPLYYVSKLLRDAGVTVVQVGEGSDELFCGYSSYARYLDMYTQVWYPSQRFVPRFMRQGAYKLASAFFPHKKNRLDMLKNWAEDRHLFWSGATAFSELWKRDLLYTMQPLNEDPIVQAIYPAFAQQSDSYCMVDYHLHRLYQERPEADFFTSMMYLELKHRLPELLLMRVDKMTMATSVEARVPFLDHEVVEAALSMPASLKYKNGITKYILKKAAEGILPQDIIYRPKMGFAAPTMRWFKQDGLFNDYFVELLRNKKESWGHLLNFDEVEQLYKRNLEGTAECSVQLWTLQNLMAVEL